LTLAAALATSSAWAHPHAASAPACSFSETEIWFGDGEGGGTAGHTYFPIEFSNVGHSACTLDGYPGVSAYSSSAQQVGAPATRVVSAHTVVTLAPHGTAHALLGIAEAGASCSAPVQAVGLTVYAPGQHTSQGFEFGFPICSGGPSVLDIGPVRAGIGIPGYTSG
jgi:hypothetical protein